MNKKSWIHVAARFATLATLAGLATTATAQPVSVTLSGGPPGNAQRWGTDLRLFATVSGPCSSSPTLAILATFVLGGAAANRMVSGISYNSVPCNGGTLTAPFAFAPAWWEIDSGWQTFRSTAYDPAGTPQADSAPLSLRFDPEVVLPTGVAATLATGASGFASCDARIFQQLDREGMGVPPPPPNYRTPVEMFRVVTSRCTNSFTHLLNVQVPPRFDGILVYDHPIIRDFGWRESGVSFCLPTNGGSACFYDSTSRKFERSANITLLSDNLGGLQAAVAFWSRQYDVRGYDLQDMWWAGPSESGWGLNIAKNGEKLFITGYIYDAEGKPTWVYMPNGQWDTRTMVWYGDLYSPQGSRYDAYDSTFLRLGAPIGTGSISFTDTENGHFDYTIDGRSGGKAIGRYHFAPPQEAPGKYTGIWWGGPDQAGWGLSVSHQADTVFATWYTYGIDQKATWFFMPAGQQTAPGVFSGELYRATGAPWAGQHYSADSTKVTRVGTMELRFGTDKPGTLSAVVDGNVISMTLIPFDF